MKYLNITSFIIMFTAIMFAGVFAVAPAPAYAVESPLEVVFTPDPLFDADNFLPGDEVSGTVEVTNNSGEAQNVIVEAINVVDDDGFGDKLWLTITQNPPLYNDNFGTFLTNGELLLSTLSSGESETYTFTVSFIDDSDNTYQGKSLGFDLCVGFEGGDTNCGDTVVGGEGDFEESDGGGGGGGGAGSGSSGRSTAPDTGGSGGGGGGSRGPLVITSESDTVIVNDTSVTITWTTNYLSTSQVVYSSSAEPHIFDINAPLFGYAHGEPVPERSNKVTNHSETLTGLSPGTTYFYRVISRASPPTISKELSFTTGGTYDSTYNSSYLSPVDATVPQADQSALSGGGNANAGEVNTGSVSRNNNANIILAGGIEGGGAGISVPEDISPQVDEEEIEGGSVSQNAAAAFFGFPQNFSDWLKYITLFAFIIAVIYIIFFRRRKRDTI